MTTEIVEYLILVSGLIKSTFKTFYHFLMLTNTLKKKKESGLSNLKMLQSNLTLQVQTLASINIFFSLLIHSFKAALRQNPEVCGICLQCCFLHLSSLFLYSFKSLCLVFPSLWRSMFLNFRAIRKPLQ